MALDVLESCKKCIVQRIINPSAYMMVEYDKGSYYKEQVKLFEVLLASNVEKVEVNKGIPIGTIVAIKSKTRFCRGEVVDVFNRRNEITYWVLLVDHGGIVEVTQKNVYFIKTKELRKKTFSLFKVTIQGIQPVVLDLDYKKNLESGIFQKRVCNTWSVTAFKFVKDLISKTQHVFVKALQSNQGKIVGEIYFTQDFDEEPVSLGQLLCDKGFATFCDIKTRQKDYMQGENNADIEKKIPKKALLGGQEKSEVPKTFSEFVSIDKKETGEISGSESVQSRSSFSSTQVASENKNSKLSITATKLSANSCNSSTTLLKKCSLLCTLTPSSSNDSLKKKDIYETQEVETNSPKTFKVNVFRVVQRNMELFYNKEQENVKGQTPG